MHKSENLNDLTQVIVSVAHDSFNNFHKYKQTFPFLPKKLIDSLKSVRTNSSIIITRPDKGRGTVILD